MNVALKIKTKDNNANIMPRMHLSNALKVQNNALI